MVALLWGKKKTKFDLLGRLLSQPISTWHRGINQVDLERLELCSISLLPLVELKLQLVHVGTTSTRGSNKGQTIEMVIEKQPKWGLT